MIQISPDEFDRVVAAALDDIPEEFQPYLENVMIEVRVRPDRTFCERHDVPADLLGLYIGVPVEFKGPEQSGPPLPDRVILFSENLQQMCTSRDELIREIRVTVLHEIGHHFGLDEDQLDELGYG